MALNQMAAPAAAHEAADSIGRSVTQRMSHGLQGARHGQRDAASRSSALFFRDLLGS